MLDRISDLRFEIVKTSHKILKGNVKGTFKKVTWKEKLKGNV